jgi:hypothetical protein
MVKLEKDDPNYPICAVLVKMRALSKKKLKELIEKYEDGEYKCSFVKFLLRNKEITNEQLRVAMMRHKVSNSRSFSSDDSRKEDQSIRRDTMIKLAYTK